MMNINRNLNSAKLLLIFPVLIGFLFCLIAFYPGWMTPDSLAQYIDAKNDFYNNWHPVLMAYYWNKLLFVSDGPAVFLIQNLVLYWGGVYLLSLAIARRYNMGAALLTAFLFFSPSLITVLGTIWKDVVFAVNIFFCFALLIYRIFTRTKIRIFDTAVILFLLILALGSKPNGLFPVIACVAVFLRVALNPVRKKAFWFYVCLGTIIIAGIAFSIVPKGKIKNVSPIQYTLVYDCLGLTVKSDGFYLPEHLVAKFGKDKGSLTKYYFPGGNNYFYYNSFGDLTTTDPDELRNLHNLWFQAVKTYPLLYLEHRWDSFRSLLRIGEEQAAYVANVGILPNSYQLSYKGNSLGQIVEKLIVNYNTFYLSWIYLLLVFILGVVLNLFFRDRFLLNMLLFSIWMFVLPHFFIAPASDYRYLYCSNLLVYVVSAIFVGEMLQRFFNYGTKFFSRHKNS